MSQDIDLVWAEPQSPEEIMDEVIEKYGYDRYKYRSWSSRH
jgi:hypothetical protein